MKQIAAFFKLIRWPNLLIVFFTQLFICLCVLRPTTVFFTESPTTIAGHQVALFYPIAHFLNFPNFLLLSLSVLLIAAAGYIINDFYDLAIDKINKPEKVILGSKISIKVALLLYALFNIISLAIALYLSIQVQLLPLWLIQLFCVGLLWVYAAFLKRRPIWGNIVVAFLSALVIIILPAYEPILYSFIAKPLFYYSDGGSNDLVNPLYIIVFYAYFAFMVSWMREIVKDIQDMEGDRAEGSRTFPLLAGIKKAGCLVIVLGILVAIPLLVAVVAVFNSRWLFLSIYIFIALLLPVIWLCLKIPKDYSTAHFGNLSRQLKTIMVLGIGSLIVYFYLSFVV